MLTKIKGSMLDPSAVSDRLGYTPANSTSTYSKSEVDAALATKQASLGFTPYNATNPNGYISSINSSNVTSALGFTPYNSTNPSGYINGINSSMVTNALGYNPANSSSFAVSIASSGWQKLSGGLIIQWGWRPNGGVGFFWQAFPMTFPNACFGLTTNVVRSSAMGDYRGWYGANTSGAYIATDQGDAFYIAVGY